MTVHNRIIRVALKRTLRERAPHPDVECIVQEEVGQERTDDAALRRSSGPRFQGTVQHLNGGTQPPRDVQPEPRNVGVVSHGAFDEIVIQGVKESLDVHIDDPVVRPAALPRCLVTPTASSADLPGR